VASKRRNRTRDDAMRDEAGSRPDRLGDLMSRYQVSLVGVLIMSSAVACVGLGLGGYALSRQPMSIAFLVIGAFVLLFAVALLGTNLFNVGRRLEVRKRGIRFVEAGVEIDMLWQDMAGVEVDRTDETDLGEVTVRRRGVHYAAATGPLTRSEWVVTIHSHDGRRIRLGPTFLRIVPDVGKLVSQLRMRAGV
jgi:hypothetical protein